MKMQKVLSIHPLLCLVCGVILFFITPLPAQSEPVWRVDDQGNLTINGDIFRVRGGSWTGLEGRQEPNDNPDEHCIAPIEMYIGNVWWAESGRTYEQDINEFKQMGFNLIRLPIVHQTLDPNEPDGRAPNLKNATSVQIENPRLALETVIRNCADAGLYVLLDIHSCNNYVGWRAGRLDDKPPWVDADWNNYDFERESYDCGDYDLEKWLADLREVAGMGAQLGVDNIMGIEIFNEPYDYTWTEWRSLIDQAYDAVNSVNSNILIFAGGIGPKYNKYYDSPHGAKETTPNWGENLYEAGSNPPSMPKDRLVYCPHVFGPSMYVQRQFMDPARPECEGLEGDEAGDMQCNIVINPDFLEEGWEEHFGYLKSMGYAVVIGAFGGNPDWPDNGPLRDQDRWGWLPDHTVDWQWQNAFLDYLAYENIFDTIYWSINPESYSVGGIYNHVYNPLNNTGGWGTWEVPDQRKLDLLYSFRNKDPRPGPVVRGDVNSDDTIDIVDALLTAQYYVGLYPHPFSTRNADVDCDGSVTIVDALLIARYYVGNLSSFTCS